MLDAQVDGDEVSQLDANVWRGTDVPGSEAGPLSRSGYDSSAHAGARPDSAHCRWTKAARSCSLIQGRICAVTRLTLSSVMATARRILNFRRRLAAAQAGQQGRGAGEPIDRGRVAEAGP